MSNLTKDMLCAAAAFVLVAVSLSGQDRSATTLGASVDGKPNPGAFPQAAVDHALYVHGFIKK